MPVKKKRAPTQKAHDETCPNCGYCQHCGRAASTPTPVWIQAPYYWPVQPWWGWQPPTTITIYGNDTASPNQWITTTDAAVNGSVSLTTQVQS